MAEVPYVAETRHSIVAIVTDSTAWLPFVHEPANARSEMKFCETPLQCGTGLRALHAIRTVSGIGAGLEFTVADGVSAKFSFASTHRLLVSQSKSDPALSDTRVYLKKGSVPLRTIKGSAPFFR